MLNKVKNYMDSLNMIKDKQKVILAFSYGVDSRTLLDILLKLGYEVVLAHVNHQKRLESKLEENEANLLAKELGLKIYVHHLEVDDNTNFHDDAHHKRYQFFMDVAKRENTNLIVTAHHQNDNLETILLNIIKGSNLYGYSGISPILNIDEIKIIRPLLCVGKDEIIKYSLANNLKYFEDESNNEDYYKRNRIRHKVIPLLVNENPNLLNSINNYSSILSDSFNYIRSQSINYVNNSNNKIILKEYLNMDRALRTDLISYLLEENEIDKNFALINQIDEMLLSNRPQADISLSDGYIFLKRYDVAYVNKHNKKEPILVQLNENDKICVNGIIFYLSKNIPTQCSKYIKLCYNDLVFPLTIRTRKDGDRIKMKYGHKKIKDLLMDLHMPKEKRDEVLILENEKEILWVYDIAKSETLCNMKNSGDIYLISEVQENE